jgi:hypothetical protein
MVDSLNETITKLKSEIEEHVATIKSDPAWTQIDKLYRALGTIEELADQPRTSLVELFGIEGASGHVVRVKEGEFYGLEPLDAAKRFLKKKGEAASLDAIIMAIGVGGVTANKDNLRMSLSRSTWDVAKVGDDLYGLLEFYPHVKRGNRGKKAASNAAEEPSALTNVEAEALPDEPTGT